MRFRSTFLGLGLPILFVIAAGTGSASAANTSSCPSSGALGNFQQANNVAATFSNSGSVTTYSFSSVTNENPSGGVPGLIKYCVYPSPATQPTSVTVNAKGANGSAWTSSKGSGNFSFARPSGDKSNIPLDGTSTVMGTATWSTLPKDQTILLHINDPTVCNEIYGDNPGTCFVKPGEALSCDMGDATVAYNANPFGVIHCPKASLGFEATATNEFGDEVKIGKATTGTTLTVEFNSYGCGDSGHWYNATTDTCQTTPGESFTIPITANIYDHSDLTTPLASGTVTVDQTIPFRPSADAVNCPGTGQWFDALGPVGSQCRNSLSILLTFNFPSLNLSNGADIVWTVQYDTSHSGYNPIGQAQACNSTDQGCGYDSLNVGAWSFAGAPYAGMDVVEDVAFISFWNPGYPPPFGSATLVNLESQTGWTGFRPLGEISQTP